MYRVVEFESEEYVTKKINYLVKYRHSLFQTVIMDDDDESYLPNFDFSYEMCDCKKVHNLNNRMTWDKFFELDKPIIFTNTTDLFKQFDNFLFLNKFFIEDGAEAFAQVFYLFYRDKLWNSDHSKFIFFVSEENLTKMYRSVNAGFTIELNPICMRKKENAKQDTQQYVKRYEIGEFLK